MHVRKRMQRYVIYIIRKATVIIYNYISVYIYIRQSIKDLFMYMHIILYNFIINLHMNHDQCNKSCLAQLQCQTEYIIVNQQSWP